MYDVIIIGRGPAGISASLYTSRAGLKTLVIGKNDSALRKAEKIDNYYGFSETISGEMLLREGEKQALRFGVEIIEDEVIAIEKDKEFKLSTSSNSYFSKAVLMATGQPRKKVSLDNMDMFEGRGISYCSTCDGFFYRNMKVGVLGYKDYAIHEALELEAYTSDITIYTNGMELELSKQYMEAASKFNINYRPIKGVEGTEFLEKLVFKDGTEEKLDGLFIAYGSASSLDFARKLGIIIENDAIVVNKDQSTNLEGLYAAGDCTGGFKQIATAVGQGALAGKNIIDYVRRHK